MRRSPASSCSSSSSCVAFDTDIAALQSPHHQQSQKIRAKRKRKTQDESKSPIHSPNNASSGRRSSIYRGVTRHRWTGRFEAHLWDKSSWNSIQNKKGRQVYLGAYDNEDAAARTYDLAALKYWGPGTTLNFPLESYSKEIEEMMKVSKEEYLASLRRRSSGFSRGVSKYRGVARHHHNGRWEARIGRVFGSKYLYLGTYNTQEEAAAAYDMAAIEYRGANAVTNFDISNYIGRLKDKPLIFPTTDKQAPPECSPPSEEGEVIQRLEQQQQQQPTIFSPRLQYSSSIPSVMEPNEEHDLHWAFLDTGFGQLPVPDLPVEKSGELADLFFGEIGFEDDIDLIFETTTLETERCEGKKDGEEGRLLSTTSPSSSTTTSVSCEFRV